MAAPVSSIRKVSGSGWRAADNLVRGLSRSPAAGAPYLGECADSRILSASFAYEVYVWKGHRIWGVAR
jgi:hypothetical protein